MGIITISREQGALGDETAHELSKLIDYRFLDKRSLEGKMRSHSTMDRAMRRFDERSPPAFASFSPDRDVYFHFLKTTIVTEAAAGNCVFIGRGAGAIFQGIPGVMTVFLSATEDLRLERVKGYFHCDDKKARQLINQRDQDRTGFHRYFFDVDWKDPGNYHLCLNTGYLSAADAAQVIKDFKDRYFTPESEAQGAAYLQDLALSQTVAHHILYECVIPVHYLDVKVSQGVVTLMGIADSQTHIEAAVAAAQEVSGIVSVNCELSVVRDYNTILMGKTDSLS
jgi:cytidylate kinase